MATEQSRDGLESEILDHILDVLVVLSEVTTNDYSSRLQTTLPDDHPISALYKGDQRDRGVAGKCAPAHGGVPERARGEARHHRAPARRDQRAVDARDRDLEWRDLPAGRRRDGHGAQCRDDRGHPEGDGREERQVHDHRHHRHRGDGHRDGRPFHSYGESDPTARRALRRHGHQPNDRADDRSHGREARRHHDAQELARRAA